MSNIKTEIEQFAPIDLREMADVNLMNRIDTKFAFRQEDLLRFLPILAADYRALKVEGTMLPHYESCLLYTSPSPRDYAASRMPSSA